ncbi:MAG: hypothetical protein AMXMBFR47_02630 [Planctomycetota bacterium]
MTPTGNPDIDADLVSLASFLDDELTRFDELASNAKTHQELGVVPGALVRLAIGLGTPDTFERVFLTVSPSSHTEVSAARDRLTTLMPRLCGNPVVEAIRGKQLKAGQSVQTAELARAVQLSKVMNRIVGLTPMPFIVWRDGKPVPMIRYLLHDEPTSTGRVLLDSTGFLTDWVFVTAAIASATGEAMEELRLSHLEGIDFSREEFLEKMTMLFRGFEKLISEAAHFDLLPDDARNAVAKAMAASPKQ